MAPRRNRGAAGMLRIISGERRGHKFDGPKSDATRPTTDLVREAIFNILRDGVEGREVVDLFAGTGALGLEALSRGAPSATFVERDREGVALIKRNLSTLRFDGRGVVLMADAYRWVKALEPGIGGPWLVFVDPPYRDYERKDNAIAELLRTLAERLPADSIVVAESGGPFAEGTLPDPPSWDVRKYGGTYVAVRVIGEPAADG